MKSISEILQSREETGEKKVLFPRQEIIKKFVDEINPPRAKKGMRPYPVSYIASKMYNAGLKGNWDLWIFYGYCRESKNFSACWHWSLDAKNAKTK